MPDNELAGLINYEIEPQHTEPEITGPPPESEKAEDSGLNAILDIILGVSNDV